MNKSKFLKKSLAALLAVMLVVAMVPLSALAADELVPFVYVNSKETTFENGTFKGEVSGLGGIDLTWAQPSGNMPENTTMAVDFIAKNGQTINSTITNLENVAERDGNDFTLQVKVTVNDESDSSAPVKTEETYPLVITLKEDAAKNNANIRDIYIDGVTATVSNVENLITLNMGFGATLPTKLQTPSPTPYVGEKDKATDADFKKLINWFTPENLDHVNKMTWTKKAATDPYPFTLKVETESGTSKEFNVKQVWEKGFTSFTVPNQIGDTRISTDGKKVDIDMPATTDFSKLIVPTFELDSKQVSVKTKSTQGDVLGANTIGTAGTPSNVAVTSGVTGLDFSKTITTIAAGDKAVLLNLTDKNGKVNEVVVTLHVKPYNTNDLKSVEFKKTDDSATLEGSVKTDIAESGVTKVYVKHDATLATANILAVASKNATVTIDGQDITGTVTATNAGAHYSEYKLANVDVKTGTVTIRVTPEDGTPSKEYRIDLVKDIDEGQIRSFFIKGNGNTFVGKIDASAKSVVVDVPYSEGYAGFDGTNVPPAPTGIANYDVYMTLTAGAEATFLNTNIGGSGVAKVSSILGDKKVNDVFSVTSAPFVLPGNDLEVKISTPSAVVGGTPNVDNWKIRINVGKPSYGHTMFNSGNELVGTNNLGLITADNTYSDITVGTGTDTNGNQINTIEVKVPYSFNANYLAFTKWNVSENAVVARTKYSDGTLSNWLKKMPTDSYDDLNDKYLIPNISINKPNIANAVMSDGRISTNNAQAIYVINQSAWGNAGEGSLTALANLKPADYTVYYLYCVKQPAATGAEIVSIESTTDKNVTAKLNPVTKHVEITVPYSYSVTSNNPMFSLNFTLSSQASMKALRGSSYTGTNGAGGSGQTDGFIKLTSDKGTTATLDRSFFYVYGGMLIAAKEEAATNTVNVLNNAATPGAVANKEGKLVVTSESGTVTNEYPIDFKIDLEQTEAKLNSLKVAGVNGTIGELDSDSKATVTLELPVGTQLNEQTIDLAVSKMAKVTVNGFDYSADRKFDLSKDVTIKVVSEDKSKENTYILKTTLRQGFNDVHENDWFYSEVMEAVANGWIKGRGNGIFDPYGSMNRGDFALIIARMDKSFDATDSEGCPFPDVTGEEYQAAAKYVYEKGYMTGDPDGNFAPSRALNRQEAAKVMCIMNGLAEEAGETTYADNATISDWAKGYVKAATTAGIFKGEGEDFNPGRYLRRCEGAAILVRSAK